MPSSIRASAIGRAQPEVAGGRPYRARRFLRRLTRKRSSAVGLALTGLFVSDCNDRPGADALWPPRPRRFLRGPGAAHYFGNGFDRQRHLFQHHPGRAYLAYRRLRCRRHVRP